MPTTLVHPTMPVDSVADALTDAGLEAGRQRRVERTVLDSFDGRLYSAGLRLEVRIAEGSQLVMSGRGVGEGPVARLVVDGAPRFVGDLPVGPFRSRVGSALGERALLPVLTVVAERIRTVRRDRRHKATVTVEIYGGCSVRGDRATEFGATFAEVSVSPGHGDDGAAVYQTLRSIGLRPVEGDLLALGAAAAGVELQGRQTSATVPLDPEEAATEGFCRVFRNLAETVAINRPGVLDDVDPEFLHELRVAVRRTRSLLSRGRGILPDEVRERFSDGFGWLGEVTGQARDLDVYILEWDTYVEPLSSGTAGTLAPVVGEIERRRRAAYGHLATQLRSDRYEHLLSSWTRWLEDDASPGLNGGVPLGSVVAERVTKAQRRLVRDGRAITPASAPERLHDLRKDAKKLRYLIECFGSLFERSARKRFVQRLKALQDNLGEHQDTEVHIAQLRELANELHATSAVDADALLATGQLTEHLEGRRRAARAAFVERFASYDTATTQRSLDDLIRTASA